MLRFTHKIFILLAVALAGIISVFFFDRIPQDRSYHLFADERTILFIPNFFNVTSNVFFVIVGFFGMYYIYTKSHSSINRAKFMFFLGIFLTGIGSAYYHLSPSNETLVWDRLPMTISFMSFLSIIVAQYVDASVGKNLLFPFIALGIASVMYWHKTELSGHGDLRFYALVQYLSLLLILLIILLFRSKRSNWYLLGMLLFYVLAKVCEYFDAEIFMLMEISGHSAKHVLASATPFIYLMYLRKKRE